jgi:signal transduction histidine kinase
MSSSEEAALTREGQAGGVTVAGAEGQGHISSTLPGALPGLSTAGLDDLLREVLRRVGDVLEGQRRLRLLLDAVVNLAGDLSLGSVLSRIVEAAADLAEADYAALGVLGAGPDRRLRAFVTHGLSDEQRVSIGDLPRGHGLLGQIIDDPRPLRIHDIAAHPASYGFPPNHPPMHSFLGVPVRSGDRVFGNLYLTEKRGGGDFTEDDEAIVVALAAAAGVVVENARLYEEAARREAWLEATAAVTATLSAGDADREGLQALVDRARKVASADVVSLLVRGEHGALEVQAVSGVPATESDRWLVPDGPSLAGLAANGGKTVVVEDVAEDPRAAVLRPPGWPEIGPVILVPLGLSGGITGALSLAWTPEHVSYFRDVDARLPARFAQQAGLALQVARARKNQQKIAVFEDRDRIARDLHDLVIQRLFAVGLTLESSARLSGQPEVRQRVGTAVDDIDATIKEIRRSIFGLNVSETSTDLRATVTDLVRRSAKVLGFTPTVTWDGPVDTVVPGYIGSELLAVLGEALTNISRHAQASRATVALSAGDDIALTVADDGIGMPEGVKESGMQNMRERAEGLGGTCVIESTPQAGTTVRWVVPRG